MSSDSFLCIFTALLKNIAFSVDSFLFTLKIIIVAAIQRLHVNFSMSVVVNSTFFPPKISRKTPITFSPSFRKESNAPTVFESVS
jgi:hypothetical protein